MMKRIKPIPGITLVSDNLALASNGKPVKQQSSPGLMTEMMTSDWWMLTSIKQIENLLYTLNGDIPWQESRIKEAQSTTPGKTRVKIFTPVATSCKDISCLQELQRIAREITTTRPLNIIKAERRKALPPQGFSLTDEYFVSF